MKAEAEWLEADGLGGFASGTAGGVRTRRYHALLLTATTPPTGRMVLVNGFEASVEIRGRVYALSSQAYPPDLVHPDGRRRIESFASEPWPSWIFRLENGTRIRQELFVPEGFPAVALCWSLLDGDPGVLSVRPFFSGRDYHSLHHENPNFGFTPERRGDTLRWAPYTGVPPVFARSNGAYAHHPDWYRQFLYEMERERGLDFLEDLASPGTFTFDLARGEATLLFATTDEVPPVPKLRDRELARRRAFPTRLHRSADSYVVRRGAGRTIIAGYPWFTDWGRDTFISMRGLCLATGRLDDARDILSQWASAVSEGMLPNRFSDHGEPPEFNSVDAPLWFVIAVHDYCAARGIPPEAGLVVAVEAILEGYARGTRYRIHADSDGLLAAGEPGVQLTWMDAKIGDWVVTPRIGKPVEIQALWLNALHIGAALGGKGVPRWRELFERGLASFRARFWNSDRRCLFDVVDVDHRADALDPSLRPNQIFAIGGLPLALIEGERARAVVDAVEKHLWTPMGLRSLAPGEPHYSPHYGGSRLQRDAEYHQGTAWPWLLGPFVEAWARTHGGTAEARRLAEERFLAPFRAHVLGDGLGHGPEIADAEPPHAPRGCPFQAWSLAELLRVGN